MKSSSPARDSRAYRLRWEIAVALAVKIALVVAIKLVFFSDPPSNNEVATRMAERLAGSTQGAAANGAPRSTQDRDKP